MMEKNIRPVNFYLSRIITLQFAILEECFKENEEIDLSTSINFGIGKEDCIVASRGTFSFEIEQKPFLKLETSCEFKIDKESWDSFHQEDNSLIIFPQGLMTHLTTIMVGTARGVLHAKTESTAFNRFPLPTVNVTELVTEDVVMNLED